MKGVEEKTEAEPAGPDPGKPDARSQARDGACAPDSELRPALERRQVKTRTSKASSRQVRQEFASGLCTQELNELPARCWRKTDVRPQRSLT